MSLPFLSPQLLLSSHSTLAPM
ncbi:hypothetical protein Patl1_13753 [Pistacia atlantica]|uniref:Uncharacterized protein n=1 Tax=Pistacia atlantica TaxID=434234 RepID=A0ACC1AY51_9ROSI|nr:hypothetical protein Patl1_13753 [Pistacia atlantica]